MSSYPGVKAMDNVSFSIRKGEIMALLGENGAGKSTLIKVLTGVYTRDAGTITLNGEVIAPHSTADAHWHCLSGSESAAEYVGGG